jgi:hypothetical protein
VPFNRIVVNIAYIMPKFISFYIIFIKRIITFTNLYKTLTKLNNLSNKAFTNLYPLFPYNYTS